MRMLCKAAGIVCVAVGCLLAGLELERALKRRYQICQEMEESLELLEKEMVFHRTPLEEALAGAAARCQTELRAVYQRASELVRQGGGHPFEMLWAEAVEESRLEQRLGPEESRLVQEVWRVLCNTDTVMQRTLLMQYRERFGQRARELERTYREKGALYRKLAVSAGAFLALLLL